MDLHRVRLPGLHRFARTLDQDQAAHAFGISVLSPNFSGPTPAGGMDVIKWYWGSAGGSGGGSIAGLYLALYQSMHYSGPTLTAANLDKGVVLGAGLRWRWPTARPCGATGSARPSTCPTTRTPGWGPTTRSIWWNPEGTIAGLPGKGAIMFMNGGKRAGYGDFPKREPKFFERARCATTSRSDGFVGGVVPAVPPCNGCPSSGGVAS